MGVSERIIEHAERLTATERRIAEVIAGEPQTIAFGTVALVAKRAGTSGPSVVRLAVKLGYAGFVDLQAEVQRELARQLGPARDRIRQQPPTDLLSRVAAVEQDNVARTLGGISPRQFAAVVDRLAARDQAVWVLPGDATASVGTTLAVPLSQLRDGVTLLTGSEVRTSRMLGGLRPGDTFVAIDIRRYERWLVELSRWAVRDGAVLVAITDSPLSPLASAAAETLFISAQGVGPFDSMAGGVALVNAIVAGVAAHLRETATSRLDTIETAWTGTQALVGSPDGSALPPSGPAGRMIRNRRAEPGRSAGQPPHKDRGQGDAVDDGPFGRAGGLGPVQGGEPVEQAAQAVEP
jgi:DNA-binding MurR/RpiR family transcriptional regulator